MVFVASDPGWRLVSLLDDLIDVYPPVAHTKGLTKKGSERQYPGSPVYVAVPCYYIPTPDFQTLQAWGIQITEDNIMTQDVFIVHLSQDMGADYQLVLRTIGHPDTGSVWITQGEPQDFKSHPPRMLDFRVAFAKKAPGNL